MISFIDYAFVLYRRNFFLTKNHRIFSSVFFWKFYSFSSYTQVPFELIFMYDVIHKYLHSLFCTWKSSFLYTFVKNQLTIGVKIYFWIWHSVSLISISTFTQTSARLSYSEGSTEPESPKIHSNTTKINRKKMNSSIQLLQKKQKMKPIHINWEKFSPPPHKTTMKKKKTTTLHE